MNPVTMDGCAGARILIVDDDARNRELLHDLLVSQGYAVAEAQNGEEALLKVAQWAPHAVLLDVMMPGLSGFEVCSRLKADPVTAAIPVLLVTALQDHDDRMAGIQSGANDFLTKPIDMKEVALRARNAVYTKLLYDRLQEDFDKLQKLEQLRDNLTHMIVHDLRSPLTSVYGALEIFKTNLAKVMSDEDRQFLGSALFSCNKLIEMISSLLDVSRMEAGEMPINKQPCDLRKVIDQAVELLGGMLKDSAVLIECSAEMRPLSCDAALIQRVVFNLLSNAVKYSPRGGAIKIAIQQRAEEVQVSVSDQGRGIPAEYHARIFDKFGQVETAGNRKQHSSGLGLTFCKLVVQAHGGRIGLDSTIGHGTTFWFVLPNA